MTKKEATELLAVLKAAYPGSYSGMNKEAVTGTVTVWAVQFADMPADIVMMAVQKLISSNKFPPTIAEVKNKIQTIHWEAYERLSSCGVRDALTEGQKAQIRRIYEVTKGYRVGTMAEPTLTQMLAQPAAAMLEG